MKLPTTETRLKIREKPLLKPVHFQYWLELLFLHWAFDPKQLQKLLPSGLYIDTYNDAAYVGVIPFFMRDIKPSFFGRMLPGVNFYEMNVRTYVYDDEGTPGIWFFSLDSSYWLAAKYGQIRFHLPYFYSQFNVKQKEEWVHFQCAREPNKIASYTYKRGKLLGQASPDSLEFFLLERYLFFSANKKGQLLKVLVHHEPYEMYIPEVAESNDQPLLWNALIPLDGNPVHQMVSKGVNVDIYPIRAMSLT